MSFRTFAQKVRDPDLRYAGRVSALRSCVQMYRPIGFRASLSYLTSLAGPFQHDEASLLRALDALTASRDLWLVDVSAYAAIRRQAKRAGRRSPRPQDPNPSSSPALWYGAPRPAALHALGFWRVRMPDDPLSEAVDECVAACLGPLTGEERTALTARVAALRRSCERPGLYDEDPVAYFRARDLLTVTGFIQTALDPRWAPVP